MDNANFKGDQKNFSKKVEGRIEHVGKIAEKEKFLRFYEEIWDKDDRSIECHGWKV